MARLNHIFWRKTEPLADGKRPVRGVGAFAPTLLAYLNILK